MNKPTITALYGLLVILVFFGISAFIQSCGGKKKADDVETDLLTRAEAVADAYTKDDIFEDDDEAVSLDDEDEAVNISYTSDPDEKPRSRSVSKNSNAANHGGAHMIVAGNYLLEENADKMIQDLKRKGFATAEKTVFDLSQYHTVIAGRYADRKEADRRAAQLKRAGIDTYVITKK